jgi:hypothetical protein
MSNPRVVDVRDAMDARPGQQQQTVAAANLSREAIEGCTCTLLVSFVPRDEGGFIVEIGVAGRGPRGFGKTVTDTLRAAADLVGEAMTRQERAWQ